MPLGNGPGGLDMSASFNLFSHSFDSLGGVMPNLDVGALNSFGGIGGTGSDGVGVAAVPSMSLSFLQQDSNKSPKSEPAPMIKEDKKGNDGNSSGEGKKKKSKKGKDDLSRAEILSGSPIKLSGLSPNSFFVMPVGGENAVMADLVLNGGGIASGGLIDDTYGGRPKYRSAASGHGQAYSNHPGHSSQPYHNGYSTGSGYSQPHGQALQRYKQSIPPPIGVSPLEGAPAFYFVLRRWRKCFGRFTFLLPGLKVRETCSVNVSAIGGITLANSPSKSKKVAGQSVSTSNTVHLHPSMLVRFDLGLTLFPFQYLCFFPCSCPTSIPEAKDSPILTPLRSRLPPAESLQPCVRSAGASSALRHLHVRLALLQSFVPNTPVAASPRRNSKLHTRKGCLSDIMRITIAFRGKLKIHPRSLSLRKKTSQFLQRTRDLPKREANILPQDRVEEEAVAWAKQKARAQVLLLDHQQETLQR